LCVEGWWWRKAALPRHRDDVRVKALEATQVSQSIIDPRPAWLTFADAGRVVAPVDACMAGRASRL